MKGDLVIVRAFGDEALVRRVWDENDKGVWVTNDAEFELLSNSKGGIEPLLGFPRRDVFRFDPDLLMATQDTSNDGKRDWNQLTPY